MDILDLDILVKSELRNIVPYPPAARGIVQLDTSFEIEYSRENNEFLRRSDDGN